MDNWARLARFQIRKSRVAEKPTRSPAQLGETGHRCSPGSLLQALAHTREHIFDPHAQILTKSWEAPLARGAVVAGQCPPDSVDVV
jgi:hypothetical protein